MTDSENTHKASHRVYILGKWASHLTERASRGKVWYLSRGKIELATVVVLFAVIIFTSSGLTPNPTVSAAFPYEGIGGQLDVYEFARNDSSMTFTNGVEDTTFTYLGSWFPQTPTVYRGYQLHAEVTNLFEIRDPVPNGEFNQIEPGTAWVESLNTRGIVEHWGTTVFEGNPPACLDINLDDRWEDDAAEAHYDNTFTYTSDKQPYNSTLEFDIKYSSMMTRKKELQVRVALIYHTTEIGSWSETTDTYAPTYWDHLSFSTAPINGSVTLRIFIIYSGGKNNWLTGHVYFDNFRYHILTQRSPTDVALTLNNTAFVNTGNNNGKVDVYADPANKDEAILTNCWSATQLFQFNSPYNLEFHYHYSMYVKTETPDAASTHFTAPVNTNPTWEVSYTTPSSLPPSGHLGYTFGLYLQTGWALSSVENDTGDVISDYQFNTSSRFIKIDEDVPGPNEDFSIFASSTNYVESIHPQISATGSGGWTTQSTGDYYVKGDYVRVVAELHAWDPVDNDGEVSIFFPNNSIWQTDTNPVIYSNGTLISQVWLIPTIDASAAGSDWLVTVSYNSSSQCGMREKSIAVVIETMATKVTPSDGKRVISGTTVTVEVQWQNINTSDYITDAIARIRYYDRNMQLQTVSMTPDGMGGYSTEFSTSLMRPSTTATFSVELFRYGYVNASSDEGSQIDFTINLVNNIDYVMVKPAQQTGPDEFAAETSKSQGYTSLVKFHDPFQSAYVLNETSLWPTVLVQYEYYEDTGSGFEGPLASGSFSQNASTRLFYKEEPYFGDVIKVKYEVTMRIIGASWEFEQQNFTIIINVVSWATNLDAIRTPITYPPSGTGDGWTQYNTQTDTYEAHVYWTELFNIIVFYENVSTSDGIESATLNIDIEGSLYPLVELANGNYTYLFDTASYPVGYLDLYVSATFIDHAAQTIRIRLFIDARPAQLSSNHPSTTVDIPYGNVFTVVFTFTDILSTNPISNANYSVAGYIDGEYSSVNNLDGTYTFTFYSDIPETSYYVLVMFEHATFEDKSKYYEITVRPIHTTSSGSAESPSVPWGTNVIITLMFNDTDHSNQGIPGATIVFTWMSGVEGRDFWINDAGNGIYIITLNTTLVPQGTQGYTLTFTFNKTHYDLDQVNVIFQVRDIQTSLLIVDTVVLGSTSTSVPWGESLTLILLFRDLDNNTIISGASIWCDWEILYWDSVYDIASGYYNLTIYTDNELEGGFLVQITATNEHYVTGYNLQSFVIRQIRTGLEATPDYRIVEIGANATFSFTYRDLDHPGVCIDMALVTIDWIAGYYEIDDFGNGTYLLNIFTSISSVGTHLIQIDFENNHYESKTHFITVEITQIQLNIQIITPETGIWDVEYNKPVNISILVTNIAGDPINDAVVQYRWADREFRNFTYVGNGLYNVTFLANASVGYPHLVTILASNPAKYETNSTSILISINPTPTKLEYIGEANLNVVFGDSFVLSVNFTTSNGLPINEATVLYLLRHYNYTIILNGTLDNVAAGIYNVTIDTSGLEIDVEYRIFVTAAKITLSEKELPFTLTVRKIPTSLSSWVDLIRVQANSPFEVRVTLNDTNNHLLIPDATLIIRIEALTIIEEMENLGNGTYSFIGLSGLFDGIFLITIEADPPDHYEIPRTLTIRLEVVQNPFIRNLINFVPIAAVVVIFLLILWLAYVRVFSVPWIVRKMRKMAKSIGKGGSPSLSKMERARISDRTGLISEIAVPYYSSVGLTAAPTVIPAEVDWAEREAEEDAIWSELKSLPFIDYEQKLELFQQMKQIAPAERLWFIEDLRKQMADGSRFDRKVKEPEIAEDVEKELQARLATYSALSKLEKERIAAQLRKIPKEDWEEIFQTLATADKPSAETVEEKLGPAEFPSLTEKEREKLLDELKDLSDEERQKVLQTFREKRSKDVPKGKIVKDKKEFIIDDSDDK